MPTYDQDQPRDTKGRWTSSLMDSLETQLRAKGHETGAAHQLAIEIMTRQGTLDPKTGLLTAEGQRREELGRDGRRMEAYARERGKKPEEIGMQNGRPFVK